MAMSMLQTKRRIRSVSSTKKITKAMELVATSKLKKAKDLNAKIAPFSEEIFSIISYCVKNIDDKDNYYFKENDVNKKLYIIVTSTLGLCGGYNIAIEKYAKTILEDEDDLIIIGQKGIRFFKETNHKIIASFSELPSFNTKESLSSTIANLIFDKYKNGEYRQVKMIYTKFVNSLTFDPQVIQLLPLDNTKEVAKINKELLLEPDPFTVLDSLVPFALTTNIKSLLFESMLSEQASRRTAMENATDNAEELQEKLLLEYNKSRQAAITQEITEISGAANAN